MSDQLIHLSSTNKISMFLLLFGKDRFFSHSFFFFLEISNFEFRVILISPSYPRNEVFFVVKNTLHYYINGNSLMNKLSL